MTTETYNEFASLFHGGSSHRTHTERMLDYIGATPFELEGAEDCRNPILRELFDCDEKLHVVVSSVEKTDSTTREDESNVEDTDLFSLILPTASFAISLLGLVFCIIFWVQGLYPLLLPAVFVAFGFAGLAIVIFYARKRINKAEEDGNSP